MSKISEAFSNKKAFIVYLMAGDPTLDKTREYILELERSGADIIEIGIPFSDPIAEGEAIQQANLRAFASATNINRIFAMVKSLKGEVTVPLLFMTYINPVFNYGYDKFFAECVACGISGIIIPDLPFEEQDEVMAHAQAHGVEVVTLIAPTSNDRIQSIAKSAQGFIYLVSSMGVTGVRSKITTDIPGMVAAIKEYSTVPVAVGFGIHSPEQAGELSRHADGVIVGSAIVNIIAEHGENANKPLADYAKSMKAAMK